MGELRLFEVLDAREMAVVEGRVGEWPEVFGWLELWRVGRQEQQVDVVRHTQPLRGVPPRAIQDEHNLLAGTCSRLAGKGGELGFEERNAHARGQMEERSARRGMHKADEIAPGIAVVHGRNRSLANGRGRSGARAA